MARDDEDAGPWSRRLTTQVGQQMKAHRDRRGWSARELADRCEGLGHRVETQVIANMETGRRANVTAAEVVVLAAALGVPPVTLIYPTRTDAAVEVVPGREVPAWPDAVRWFTGEWPIPALADDEGELDAWNAAAEPLTLLRWQEDERRRWREAVGEVGRVERDLEAAEQDEARRLLEERVRRAEERVRDVERALAIRRGGMRTLGVDPGPLHGDLVHVDELPEAQQ